jgi:hypothetical protein
LRSLRDSERKSNKHNHWYCSAADSIRVLITIMEQTIIYVVACIGLVAVISIMIRHHLRWLRNCRTSAERLYRAMAEMYSGEHEYRVASHSDIPTLDISGYEQSLEFLRGRGFTRLGTFENATASRAFPENRTLVDAYVNRDGTVGAGSYRIQDIQMLEFCSIFDDGRALTTSNAELDTWTPPPTIIKCIFPRDTKPEELLSRHLTRLIRFQTEERSAGIHKVTSLDDVLEISRRHSRIVSELRQSLGLMTEDEMLSLTERMDQKQTARRIWRCFHGIVERERRAAEHDSGFHCPKGHS